MKREPQKDFLVLEKHAKLLRDLSLQIVEKSFSCKEDDHFAFMVLSFLTKQIEHFRSLMILIDAHQYSDATIIARIMIEGMATISWVSIKPMERAFKWRNFCVVTDYRALQERKKNGEPFTKEEEKSILEKVNSEGKMYLKKNTENIEDPYRNSWRFDEDNKYLPMEDLCRASSGPSIYKIYRSMNGWIHWDVPQIGEMIKREKNSIKISTRSIDNANMAMAGGILSLYYLLYEVDKHFKLGYEIKIKSFEESYIKALNISKNK